MRALTEVVPLSPPMASIIVTCFVVPVKLAYRAFAATPLGGIPPDRVPTISETVNGFPLPPRGKG
jgi:hypothetical protein